MIVSRAGFIRGLVASALLPAAASAALNESGGEGLFRPDGTLNGAIPWSGGATTGPAPLRFAVVGDNTGLARPGVFDQAMVQVSWLKPDFVVSVGDLIEGYTEDKAEIARQWHAIEHSIAKVGCPFISAPGNHDVNSAATLEAWRERRGAGYYAFTYKGALFLVLNTEDPPMPMPEKMAGQFYSMVELMKKDPDQAEKIIEDHMSAPKTDGGGADLEAANFSDKQLAFARDTLARHPNVRWTFVILHKPAWKMPSPSFAKIVLMLQGRPYTVFGGHTHYFTHDVINGADFINMGTTGGIKSQSGPGTMDHMMLVTLTPNGPVYASARFNGLMDVAGHTGQIRAF